LADHAIGADRGLGRRVLDERLGNEMHYGKMKILRRIFIHLKFDTHQRTRRMRSTTPPGTPTVDWRIAKSCLRLRSGDVTNLNRFAAPTSSHAASRKSVHRPRAAFCRSCSLHSKRPCYRGTFADVFGRVPVAIRAS
jgi:hypothetical protein